MNGYLIKTDLLNSQKEKLIFNNFGELINIEKNEFNQDIYADYSDIRVFPNTCKHEKKIIFQKDFYDSKKTSLNENKIVRINHENYFSLSKLSNKEYTIESFLGAKKRLPNLQAVRNGLLIISPGDKIYKNVEYQKDYFKQKTNDNKQYNININISKLNFYSEMEFSKSILNPEKIWLNRRSKEIEEFDKKYIKNLDSWEDKYLYKLKPSK